VTNPRALALSAAVGLAAAAVTFAVITAVDGGDEREGAGQPAPAAQTPLGPAAGRELFFEMGCSSCHRFADAHSTGTIGPDLDERLAAHDRESLTAAILNPPGSGTTGFSAMPDDFGSRMDARQLDALVGYLLAARSGP
jgi:mono/diheme cytochrome c family protein